MIEEQGRVVAVEADFVWVETVRRSSCSSCSARQGCGQHLSEKYKSDVSFSYIKATSSRALQEGDRVVVGIPEGSLLRASFLMYLFPLVLMMASLWLSSLAGIADGLLVLIAGSALASGFLVVRSVGKRSADMCRVEVVEVLPAEGLSLAEGSLSAEGSSEQKLSL